MRSGSPKVIPLVGAVHSGAERRRDGGEGRIWIKIRSLLAPLPQHQALTDLPVGISQQRGSMNEPNEEKVQEKSQGL